MKSIAVPFPPCPCPPDGSQYNASLLCVVCVCVCVCGGGGGGTAWQTAMINPCGRLHRAPAAATCTQRRHGPTGLHDHSARARSRHTPRRHPLQQPLPPLRRTNRHNTLPREHLRAPVRRIACHANANGPVAAFVRTATPKTNAWLSAGPRPPNSNDKRRLEVCQSFTYSE